MSARPSAADPLTEDSDEQHERSHSLHITPTVEIIGAHYSSQGAQGGVILNAHERERRQRGEVELRFRWREGGGWRVVVVSEWFLMDHRAQLPPIQITLHSSPARLHLVLHTCVDMCVCVCVSLFFIVQS